MPDPPPPERNADPQLATEAADATLPSPGASETVFEDAEGDEPNPRLHVARGDAPDYPTLQPIADDHYTAGRELAHGGMGRILSARDRRLGRRVAIKELLSTGDGLAARFEREARITAKLQHPNIIHVYEAGLWRSGEPFYAMNLVAGRPLDEVIATSPSSARLGLVANVIGAVDALAYAHSQRIVHRDLKPGNVLVGAFGETVVVDWGLAKDLSAPDQPSLPAANPSASSSDDTIAGSVLGTPAYMPPEQAAGEVVDATADVYALGAMLYHVLAGRPPYTARTAAQLLDMVEAGPPQPLVELALTAPPDLIAIVEKAMSRDRARRFPTAKEMADELKRFQTGQLVSSYHYTTAELIWRWIRLHRGAVAVAALATIVLVIGASISVRRIVDERHIAEHERERAQQGFAKALAQKGQQAEHQKAWAAAAVYYQAALRESDSPAVRFAAGRAESRMIPPVARHLGHHGWVRAVAIHERDVFTVDGEGAVRRWSIVDGQLIATITVPTPLYAAAVAPDGTRLAIGGDDGVVRVLDRELRPIQTYLGHTGRIWSLVFSPDGRSLISAGEDATVRVWTEGVGRILSGHTQRVYSVAVSPDGTRLVSASDDRTVRLWTLASGESTVLAHSHAGVRTASFDRKGKQVLFAGWDSVISLVELDHPTTLAQWPDVGSVHAAALAPDDAVIASGGDLASVRLWDPTTRSQLAVLDGHVGQVTALAFSADGSRLVTAGKDAVPRVWDVSAAARLGTGVGHHDSVWRIAFTRDGKRLVSSALDHTVRLWDLATGAERGRHPFDGNCAAGAFVTGDGSRFGTACIDGHIYAWPTAGGQPLDLSIDVGLQLHFAAVAPDSSWLATGEEGGLIQMWDLATGQLRVARKGHDHVVYGMRALADGTLLTSSLDNTVRRWSPMLEPMGEWRTTVADGLIDAILDPKGRFVIAGGNGALLYRWRLADAAALPPLAGHGDSIWSVDISPDGTLAASASSDGTIRLWDTTTWTAAVLTGPPGAVRGVAFSPDGKWLASGHESGAILLWNVATRERVRRLGASEIGDDGSCDALDRSSWHDAKERAIVALACTERPPAGLERVTAQAHLVLDSGVNIVERWDSLRPITSR